MSGQVKVKSLSIFIVVCIPRYDIISVYGKSYDETPRKSGPVNGLLPPSAGGTWTYVFLKGHKRCTNQGAYAENKNNECKTNISLV